VEVPVDVPVDAPAGVVALVVPAAVVLVAAALAVVVVVLGDELPHAVSPMQASSTSGNARAATGLRDAMLR
jgi:hypothetical protein